MLTTQAAQEMKPMELERVSSPPKVLPLQHPSSAKRRAIQVAQNKDASVNPLT